MRGGCLIGIAVQRGLQLAQQGAKRSLLGRAQIGHQRDHPGLMGGCHLGKAGSARFGESQANGAPVSGDGFAHQKALMLKLVGKAGDIAARHHQAPGQFAHAQAFGRAIKLGEQIKARQGRGEPAAQSLANRGFDQRGAGEEPQPELERRVVLGDHPAFLIEGFGLRLVSSAVHGEKV